MSTTPTSSAREEILDRIRRANQTVDKADYPLPTPPSVPPTPDVDALVELFVERVADYQAEVQVVAASGLAAAVADVLKGCADVVVPEGIPQDWLSDVTATQVTDDGLTASALDRIDAVVTGATVGIAVPGTIVLDHDAGQGRRALSLVPDLHVCVVHADQLVNDVPEAVAALADSVQAGRPLTWISGPSATSDIELSRVEGVHGPRTLRVIVIR
ncbi:LutC/YkgG family protein [Flexivirga sp. B27]